MAHACDYASRLPDYYQAEIQLMSQVKDARVRLKDWSEQAFREYAILAYGGMGLTREKYAKIFKE